VEKQICIARSLSSLVDIFALKPYKLNLSPVTCSGTYCHWRDYLSETESRIELTLDCYLCDIKVTMSFVLYSCSSFFSCKLLTKLHHNIFSCTLYHDSRARYRDPYNGQPQSSLHPMVRLSPSNRLHTMVSHGHQSIQWSATVITPSNGQTVIIQSSPHNGQPQSSLHPMVRPSLSNPLHKMVSHGHHCSYPWVTRVDVTQLK